MRNWRLFLFPPLEQFPPAERRNALRDAAATPMDFLELAGAAAALLLATWATGYALREDAGAPMRLLACALNFAMALPLLAAIVLPLHVRRLRRGLADLLARRSRG